MISNNEKTHNAENKMDKVPTGTLWLIDYWYKTMRKPDTYYMKATWSLLDKIKYRRNDQRPRYSVENLYC